MWETNRAHRMLRYLAWILVEVMLGLVVAVATGSLIAAYAIIVLVGSAVSLALRRGWL